MVNQIVADVRRQTTFTVNTRPLVAANGRVLGQHWSVVLREAFMGLPGVDALFVDDTTSAGVVSVYVVVRQHRDARYDLLREVEEVVARKVPGVEFEYHVRAHQGREPRCAVPESARQVHYR